MALERRMVQDQARARFRTLAPGATLVEQGERGDELFLLLDGTLTAEVDGRALAELGPGSIVGERALLEGPPRADTRRTATLRAKTRCRVAVAAAHELRPPHVL
jgi:CRP-like cAMP-binding protein